ncbi:MAG TPA: ABC transporter ATP-binding protein [Ktedonobacterales bacterium]
MSLLEVHGISKAFGGISALDTCSLTVEQGSITGLIGPNGSGKTTLFNVITGYERPDAGTVTFKGTDVTNANPSTIFGLGLGRTFQLVRIFPRLTVMENMHIAVQRHGIRALLSRWTAPHERAHAQELLDFVGISHLADAPAENLSYGQKKLLEFAMILIAAPEVVLLDEPAGGVNPTLAAQLTDRIKTLNKRGITFLIVEHNMQFVMSLCDKVAVMHRGSLLTEGAPEEVRGNPAVLEAYLGD